MTVTGQTTCTFENSPVCSTQHILKQINPVIYAQDLPLIREAVFKIV